MICGGQDRCVLRYLNSAGMDLNWARIKLRENENQLSSQYDKRPLNSVIILRKRRHISERYYFGRSTRKHIEVEDGGREGGGAFLQGKIFWSGYQWQKLGMAKIGTACDFLPFTT